MEQSKNTKKEPSAPLITQIPTSLQYYDKNATNHSYNNTLSKPSYFTPPPAKKIHVATEKEIRTTKEAIDKKSREALEAEYQRINTPGYMDTFNDYFDPSNIAEMNVDPDFGNSKLDYTEDGELTMEDLQNPLALRARNQSGIMNFLGIVGKNATRFASAIIQAVPELVNLIETVINTGVSAFTGFQTDSFEECLWNENGFSWQEMVSPLWDKTHMSTPIAKLVSIAESFENWGQKNFKTYKSDYKKRMNR